MNIMKKVLSTLAGILLAALLIAALAPKATHGLVAALVQVTNTDANPVPNQDVDDPGRIAYQSNSTFGPVGCTACTATFPAVPAGKRLVIQHISVALYGVTVPTPPAIVSLILEPDDIHLSNFTVASNGNLSGYPGPGGFPIYGEQSTLAYVDAGKEPKVTLSLTSDNNITSGSITEATISGYLLDCASAVCQPIAH